VIESQPVIPEREGLHCKRPDSPFVHNRIAQVGAESQVLHPLAPVTEQSSYIADFEQQPPGDISKHG
jgi:hypothetical protein